MILKKSKITYLFWGLFLLFGTGTVLASSFNIADTLGKTSDMIIVAAVFTGIIIVSFLLSLLSKPVIRIQKEQQQPLSTFMEGVFLILIVIISFMIRFIYLTTIKGVIAGDDSLYSSILSGNFTQLLDISPVTYTYGRIVFYFIGLMGDHTVIPMYINIFLQMLIIVLLYFAVKILCGRIPAFVSVIIYAFIPYNISAIAKVNAEILLAFSYALAFLMIVYTADKARQNKLWYAKGVLTVVIAGFLGGIAAYFDKSGVIFIVFAICIFFAYPSENQIDSLSKPPYISGLYSVSFAVGLITCVIYCTMHTTNGFLADFVNYLLSFTDISINLNINTPAPDSLYSPIIICLSLVWLVRIFSIERDHCSYFLMIPAATVLCSLLGLSGQSYCCATTMLWCVLAGIGFTSIGRNSLSLYDRLRKQKEEEEEEKRIALENAKKELEQKKRAGKHNSRISTKSLSVSTPLQSSSTSDLKALEDSLEFLHKDVKPVKPADALVSNDNTNDKNKASDKGNMKAENNTADKNKASDNLAGSKKTENNKENINKENINKENINKDNTNKEKSDVIEEIKSGVNPMLDSKAPLPTPVAPEKTYDLPKPETSSAVSVSKPLENMNVADAPAATPAASKTAVPPKVTSESPSVMVSKFGRRMDYKTAVVSHKSSIADVNKAPVKPDIVEIGGTKNMSSIPYPGTNAPKDPYLAPPAELEKNSTMVPVRRSSPTPIPNPLPTPKKHVPRELDFDITPQDKDMHFDLVDMNGKDFFDIN